MTYYDWRLTVPHCWAPIEIFVVCPRIPCFREVGAAGAPGKYTEDDEWDIPAVTLNFANAKEISARMLHFYIEKNNDKNDTQLFLQWKGCFLLFFFTFFGQRRCIAAITRSSFCSCMSPSWGEVAEKDKNGSVNVNKMFGLSPSMVCLPDTDTFYRLQLDVWQKFKGFGKGSVWVSAKLTPLETRIFFIGVGLHCVNFTVLLLFLFRQTWLSLKGATMRFVTLDVSHIHVRSRRQTFPQWSHFPTSCHLNSCVRHFRPLCVTKKHN